jgi:cytoskeletal protein CcmA (bactofilin family)
MTALNYSSIAVAATLSQAVEATDTVFQISDTTGWPSVPFKVLVDQGRSSEEVCFVTSLSGQTASVLRGQDGTPASHHDVGAAIVHGFSAGEFQDSSDHIAASSDVHGVSGALVGALSTQILDHKTFQSAAGSGPPIIVQAQTGQSSNIQEFRSETGSVIANFKSNGRLATPGIDGSSSSVFTAGSAGTVPVSVAMAPGQTARAIKVVDSSNNEVMAVSPNGTVICQAVQVTGGTALGTTTGSSLTLSGDLTAQNATAHGSLQVDGNASVGGTLTATNFSTSGTLNVNALTSSTALVHRGSVPVPIMAAGTTSVVVSAASFAQVSISFPVGRFTTPPIVTASLQDAPSLSGKYSARVTNINSSGANIQVYSGDASANSTSMTVGWIAVQMTSGSASG